MADQETPVWFITGCSTGFGRELTKLLLAKGWNVVATARDTSKIADLVEGHEGNSLALALDVTDAQAIATAVAQAQERFGRIDVLVNNAGFGYLAAIEEGEDSEVRKMFDTNVFGLVALTKAVLPGMRARRSGHIVNVSSIGGLVSFLALGYYNATKFAIEGLSGALAMELAPLGIKVLLIEPGPFGTSFSSSAAVSKIEIDDYAATVGARRKEIVERRTRPPGDPVRAAQAIIDAVAAAEPPAHLLLGKPALEMARKDLETRKREFDLWEATTLGADFPT